MARKATCNSSKPISEEIISKLRSRFGSVFVDHEEVAFSEKHRAYFCVNCNRRVGGR